MGKDVRGEAEDSGGSIIHAILYHASRNEYQLILNGISLRSYTALVVSRGFKQ